MAWASVTMLTGAVARCDLNESVYPPLPAVTAALRAQISTANRYPEFLPDTLREVLANHLGMAADQVTVGAGATGVALAVLNACANSARARGITNPRLLTATPTFDGYPIVAGMLGLGVTTVALTPDGGTDLSAMAAALRPDIVAVVLCSPHNPTGSVIDDRELRRFLDLVPEETVVILDEAYREYADELLDVEALIDHYPQLIVLRTFSKAYGLAALRVGYAFGSRRVIAGPRAQELPFAVSPAASAAVPVALAAHGELGDRVRATRTERIRLTMLLEAIGTPVLSSQANFVFLPGRDGLAVGRLLGLSGIVGKPCGEYGFRITVADSATTDRMVATLRTLAMTA